MSSHLVKLLAKALSFGVKAAPASLASGVRFNPNKKTRHGVDKVKPRSFGGLKRT